MSAFRIFTRRSAFLGASVLVVLLAALLVAQHLGLLRGNLVEAARRDGAFETLVHALEVSGLADTLTGAGRLTLFAPTDAAFAQLPPAQLAALLADPEALRDLLLAHVPTQPVGISDLAARPVIPTLSGKAIIVRAGAGSTAAAGFDPGASARRVVAALSGKSVRIEPAPPVILNGSARVEAALPASNGLLYAIDRVLLPSADAPLNEPRTAAFVDLHRLQGRWYKIACYINELKGDCAGHSAEIRYDGEHLWMTKACQVRRADGEGDGPPVQRIRRETLRGDIEDPGRNSKFTLVRDGSGEGARGASASWILAVDDAYRWAIMGNPNRGYVTLIARDRVLDSGTYARLAELVARRGYDPDRLIRLPVWQDVPASAPAQAHGLD